MKLVEVRKAIQGEIPITKNTAYKWHSEKKFPNVVYKVGGILYFDLGEWEKMASKAKAENIKVAARLRHI